MIHHHWWFNKATTVLSFLFLIFQPLIQPAIEIVQIVFSGAQFVTLSYHAANFTIFTRVWASTVSKIKAHR